jgi:hypothetical protein
MLSAMPSSPVRPLFYCPATFSDWSSLSWPCPVPVVASAAVSTITTIVERASEAQLTAAREKRQDHIENGRDRPDVGEDGFHSHARFVFENWNQLSREAEAQAQRSAEKRREDQTALADEAVDLWVLFSLARPPGETITDKALDLTSPRSNSACQLESLSRSVMIGTLEKGSKAQILLQSDRNVQRRCVWPSVIRLLYN